jgi:hypothetical protein
MTFGLPLNMRATARRVVYASIIRVTSPYPNKDIQDAALGGAAFIRLWKMAFFGMLR